MIKEKPESGTGWPGMKDPQRYGRHTGYQDEIRVFNIDDPAVDRAAWRSPSRR